MSQFVAWGSELALVSGPLSVMASVRRWASTLEASSALSSALTWANVLVEMMARELAAQLALA